MRRLYPLAGPSSLQIIGAGELTKGSMNLVLNRRHSKANELKVGTGRPWRLAQARQGFFSRTDEELIDYLHVSSAPPASCALGRVA